MFGDSDPFSDFFHTFFGGAAGASAETIRSRRAAGGRAGPADARRGRAATSRRKSSSGSRTR